MLRNLAALRDDDNNYAATAYYTSYHQLYSPLKCKLVLSTTAAYKYIYICHHYHHFPNINPPLSFSPFGPPRKKNLLQIYTYIRTPKPNPSERKYIYIE